MNKVILYGRLSRDVELMYTQSAQPVAVAKFAIAVNRPYSKDNEQTADFLNCVAFGKTAENIQKYFRKGSRILVNGRIQVSQYKDKDGNNRYSTDIVVEGFDFIETKAENENGSANANNNFANANNNFANTNNNTAPADFFFTDGGTDNNDLPF